MRKFLTGNESIARGIYEAEVDVVCAYPHILKTELFKSIKKFKTDLQVEKSINEDANIQHAIRIANTGKKTLTFLTKINAEILNIGTKTEGGLVVILNDDTGMVSKDDINDNRETAKLSNLLIMEPGSSRDTKNMLLKAFEISKQYKMPVILRMTTRVGCSSGIVICDEPKICKTHQLEMSIKDKLEVCRNISEFDDFNKSEYNSKKVGFICSGICTFYTKEVLGDTVSYLDLKVISPMPDEKIIEFASSVDKLYVVEENNPYIENYLKELGIDCIGRDLFNVEGELSPGEIRKAIFGKHLEHVKSEDELVMSQEPFIDLEYILSLYNI
ncbi:hypothetical protein [Intestinibacter bartlettii]|uniref:Uncharacterized protein n=1 Tax=Intestinibacter bartlettii TaxID=261299 RepID=A0ABS6DXC6_9FIRM|nr:hypothetical protein [Intestinibacter bartlettii]MBU5336063.1 hypothetical protein [Intestinibacter bartlettii]